MPRTARSTAPVVDPPLVHVVAAFTVLVLGLNWPIMSWGVETIPPLWLTSFRLLGAGALLAVVLAAADRLRAPPHRDYPVVASVAVIRLALVYGLAFTALTYVPPGRSSLLLHTAGLWAAPIGARFLREPLSRLKLYGLLLGVTGILLLMEPWGLEPGAGAWIGYAMLIAAAIANAVGTVHVRGHQWVASPLMLMPWQLLAAGVLTTIIALAVHGQPHVHWDTRNLVVVAYQIVLASGFALWGTLTISRSLPAVSTGVLFMAVPAIGIASSVLLVDETLTLATVGGITLVFTGVAANIASDRRGGDSSEGRPDLPLTRGTAVH